MKSGKFIISAVLLLTVTLSAAAENGSVPFSNFAKGKKLAVTPDTTVDYGCFTIAPVQNIPWQIVTGKQKQNEAFWAIIDETSIMHTTLGFVKLSEPQSGLKQFSKGKNMQKLRKALEDKIKSDSRKNDRTKNVRISSGIKTFNGRKGVLLNISGIDTKSRHTTDGKPFRLFVRNFIFVTSDNRMMTISVTERFPHAAAGAMNNAAADAFLKAVKLK